MCVDTLHKGDDDDDDDNNNNNILLLLRSDITEKIVQFCYKT
jgi:hypothetical protein